MSTKDEFAMRDKMAAAIDSVVAESKAKSDRELLRQAVELLDTYHEIIGRHALGEQPNTCRGCEFVAQPAIRGLGAPSEASKEGQ